MEKSELKLVHLEDIQESTTNPRKHVDKAKLAELTESIRERGVITPVILRNVNSHLELVDGSRRLHAARNAGLTALPAIIRELSDEAALEIQVVSNLLREDVHPLDESRGYAELLKWYDVKTIAAKVSKSVSYIEKRLKLKDLVPTATKFFYDDVLTVSHAIELARLQPKDQEKALKACVHTSYLSGYADKSSEGKEAISLDRLQSWIRDNVLLDLGAVAFPKDDHTLVKNVGPCTTCPKRTGFNTELFEEIAEADRCTDGECFGKKMAAFVKKQRQTMLEKTGKEPIPVSTASYCGKKGILATSGYTPAKASDKDAVPAIIADGKGRGKTLMIKVNKQEEKSAARFAKPLTAAQKVKLEKEQREAAIRRAMMNRLPELLAKKVPGKFTDKADLVMLAIEFNNTSYDHAIQTMLGIKGKLAKQTPQMLAKYMLLGASLSSLLNDTETIEVAKRWGIDVKKLRAEVVKELEAEEKKQPESKGKLSIPEAEDDEE